MTPRRSVSAAATAALVLTIPLATAAPARAAHDPEHGSDVAILVTWNHAMVSSLEQAPVTPGPVAGRVSAIVQSSVFDAVNGVTERYTPYFETPQAPSDTSAGAAAIGAAHEALTLLFPAQQATYDALLTQTVAELPPCDQGAIDRGLAWGKKVADDISAWRADDGFTTVPPPYQPTPVPGHWQPTPPLFGPPAFRQFATMVPFTMTAPDQFLPPPPPALTSVQYAKDFNETKAYGSSNSTVRSAYGTETAILWASDSPTDLWNPVADTLILRHHLGLSAAARLLAQLNLAIGDAAIAVYNAKSYYDTWRPITAIQQADSDGNPDTTADPSWQPLLNTPSFQEYPSGHSGLSGAANAVLAAQFGNHTAFQISTPLLPGVVHSFNSFADGIAEVAQARIDAGFHFRFACDAAAAMGREISAWVTTTQMQPVHDDRR
ncbi:MAG: vanadium-dependent haloperoxidase [Mycobacterium sp.]|nr:vanadium-dependent haloperoxidase [Mycobacterium sp.]